MIEVVPATLAHVGPLARTMREIDRHECAIAGHTPKQALRLSLNGSAVAWTVKVDGKVVAMFGVSPVNTLTGEGCPWLLMSDAATKQARALLVLGSSYSVRLNRVFPVLRNVVHADNVVAIRWLRRLGYTVGPVVDMRGHPMRGFERCASQLRC